jgi:hypothetical protein
VRGFYTPKLQKDLRATEQCLTEDFEKDGDDFLLACTRDLAVKVKAAHEKLVVSQEEMRLVDAASSKLFPESSPSEHLKTGADLALKCRLVIVKWGAYTLLKKGKGSEQGLKDIYDSHMTCIEVSSKLPKDLIKAVEDSIASVPARSSTSAPPKDSAVERPTEKADAEMLPDEHQPVASTTGKGRKRVKDTEAPAAKAKASVPKSTAKKQKKQLS